jgi:YHS domain-containing protein
MANIVQRTAPCPICNMPVNTHNAKLTAQRDDRLYFFCSPGCRFKFLSQPCCEEPKGRWGRFLDRLAKANAREFGKDGPNCH